MPAEQIMREFYGGTLKSSNGAPVKSLAQAKAIASKYEHGESDKSNVKRRPRVTGRSSR